MWVAPSLAELVQENFFHREWDRESLDEEQLRLHVKLGWARQAMTPLAGCAPNQRVYSVSYRENQQRKVRDLPIGSRSLLITSSTDEANAKGEIFLRGINKFGDLVQPEVLSCFQDSRDADVDMFIQRKMAGFVVHLFSTDGKTVETMSKHSVCSEHAKEARRILGDELSVEQQTSLAQYMLEHDTTIACECISLSFDKGHPVPEDTIYDHHLVAFAVGLRKSLPELVLPLPKAKRVCESFGMMFAPFQKIPNDRCVLFLREIQEHLTRWHAVVDGAPVSEGFVVVVECRPSDIAASLGYANRCSDRSCAAPMRFKMKSAQYKVMRSLRSLILEGQPSSYQSTMQVAILSWAHSCASLTLQLLREAVSAHGVHSLLLRFMGYVNLQRRKRFVPVESSSVADLGLSVGAALECATLQTERELRQIEESPHGLVMLCGLPGSGKTSLCEHLCSVLRGGAPFDEILHISKDEISRHVTMRRDPAVSAHQLRQIQRDVHRQALQAIQYANMYLARKPRGTRVLVVLDACHATVASRKFFREVFPTRLFLDIIIYVKCDEINKCVARIASRTDHATLHGMGNAERAVYNISRIFVAPQEDVERRRVITVDSFLLSAKECAEYVRGSLNFPLDGSSGKPATYISAQEIPDILESGLRALIYALTGESAVVKPTECAKTLSAVGAALSNIIAIWPSDGIGQDWKSSLWELCVNALCTVLRSTPEQAPSATPFRSLFNWIAGSARVDGALQRSFEVIGGNAKWIPGRVLHQKGMAGASMEQMEKALLERFSVVPPLHVTLHHNKAAWQLFHDSNGATPNVCSWISPGRCAGKPCSVTVKELFFDGDAVGFKVEVLSPSGEIALGYQLGDQNVPLHITLAHTTRVRPDYCGKIMISKASPERCNKPKVAKNFVKIKVDPELVLFGHVA